MPEAHVPYLLASFSIPSPLPAYLNSAAVPFTSRVFYVPCFCFEIKNTEMRIS